MKRSLLLTLLGSSLLAGCASYHAAPLPAGDHVLVPPDMAIISADAAKIDRPFLKPQAIDFSQPLTPNALAVIAVLENPDLKAQRAKSGVSDAQAFAARLLPDPTGAIGFDKLLTGPDVYNGFAGQFALDLNQVRLASVVRESGEASKRQVRLDLAWAEWQTAGQARLLGVRILALEEQLKIARVSSAAAERALNFTLNASGRGDLSGTELDARRQTALDSADKLRLLERDLVTARTDLNKQLGLPPETMLLLAPPPQPGTPPAAATLVAQAVEQRLDLAALRAGYASSEADVHKAILEQFPTLSLTVAGARDTADNYTVGPQVGFTLPLWNRNRGNIRIATATRSQLQVEYEARLFQTRADIGAAVAGITTVDAQRVALTSAMPALSRFADASSQAAKRGDLAPITAEAAAQSLRDRQLTLLQLDQQIAEQTIALELLTGGPSEGWTR